MNVDVFYEILKIQSKLNNKFGADTRIKKDFFNKYKKAQSFFNAKYLTNYNISIQQYEYYFKKLIDDGRITKSCCNRYNII